MGFPKSLASFDIFFDPEVMTMRIVSFRKMLAARQEKTGSMVCVGLDPLEEKIPEKYKLKSGIKNTYGWMRDVVMQTAEFACMYKPQIAHWEAIQGGIGALRCLIHDIHVNFPDIPVFLDAKRGDIARTQQQYRVACLDWLGADGMNFSPYMGRDCMSALVDQRNLGRALVGLCYTSNPDAREVQDVLVQHPVTGDLIKYWQFIAERTLTWAKQFNVVDDAGLVMAAAYENPKGSGKVYSDHLKQCREIVGDKLWFLIPGIGTQGGFVDETVLAGYAGCGSIAVNSSSEIIFDKDPASKAKELRDALRAAALKLPADWSHI